MGLFKKEIFGNAPLYYGAVVSMEVENLEGNRVRQSCAGGIALPKENEQINQYRIDCAGSDRDEIFFGIVLRLAMNLALCFDGLDGVDLQSDKALINRIEQFVVMSKEWRKKWVECNLLT